VRVGGRSNGHPFRGDAAARARCRSGAGGKQNREDEEKSGPEP
jgi:hypothetical protein